jgi:hypothetical protein
MKMKKTGKIQCTRCRMGLPLGITVALIGLAGIISCALNYDKVGLFVLIPFVGLFLIGPPFARMAMLVNVAHRRIDQLEKRISHN